MLPDDTKRDSFTEFVDGYERRLRQALAAAFGVQVGREAAAEALAYGWEHWDRISSMDNPAGYLYRVGYDRARRMKKRRRLAMPPVRSQRLPWVEPGLPGAFARLPEKQRIVVGLVHGYQWTLAEVADHLNVSRGTVQTHLERGLRRLRREMGVVI